MVSFAVAAPEPQAPLASARFHQWVFPDGVLWAEFHRTGSGYLLRFPAMADYLVSADGHEVLCRPAPGVSDETIRHLYLNQVLPLALSRAGKLVLHASAVEIDGEAVAFVGESGRGKSTLAASFATSGHRFLTDDGLVIEERVAGYRVLPSHPSIRLWEDSQEALIDPATRVAESLPFTPKARFLAGAEIAFCDEPRPLRHVYFLGDSAAPGVSLAPVRASETLVQLVKHSFLLDIQATELIASHFDQLARLVSEPIYFRLDYPRRFDALGEVRRAIIGALQCR